MKTDLQPYEFHGGPLDGDVRELPGHGWFRVVTVGSDGGEAESWYRLTAVGHAIGEDPAPDRYEIDSDPTLAGATLDGEPVYRVIVRDPGRPHVDGVKVRVTTGKVVVPAPGYTAYEDSGEVEEVGGEWFRVYRLPGDGP